MKTSLMKKLSEKARSTGDRRRLLNEHRPMPAPAGHLPLYVGEEQRRFIVPMSFLSHPLFRILLEMAYLEYGFDQESGLSVPCDVSVFEEVVGAIEGGRGMFDVRRLTGVVVS